MAKPSKRRGVPEYSQQSRLVRRAFQPPVSGLDFRSPRRNPDPSSAVVLDNVICVDAGIKVRGGTVKHFNGLGGSVNTLMAYNGPSPALFAAVGNNVFDVTVKDVDGTPTAALTTAALTYPGRWSHINFTTVATTYLLAVADGAGYYTWDGSAWTNRNAAVTGATATGFNLVQVWKRCVLFAETGSSRMWYLAAGTITGALSSIDFGAHFAHGGYIAGMASWTVDGGAGIDDLLVVVGSHGDVLLYTGSTGPGAADFELKGRWYIGDVPVNSRFMAPYGGDMFVLSSAGLNTLSTILRGDPFASHTKAVARVAVRLGTEVRDYVTGANWQVLYVPTADVVVVNSSTTDADSMGKQWVLGTDRLAWSTWSSMKAMCWCEFQRGLYYSDANGNVWTAMTGSYDGVSVSDHGGTDTPGAAAEATLQQAFVDVAGGEKVQFQQVRLLFVGSAEPGFNCWVSPEFDYTTLPTAPVWSNSGASTWDSAVWDSDTWAPESNQSYSTYRGTPGLGTIASLVLRFKGPIETLFAGWDLYYRPSRSF